MTEDGLCDDQGLKEPQLCRWTRAVGSSAPASRRWFVVLAALCVALSSAGSASDRPVLNVLAPLGVLSVASVNAFEKDSGALVRTGFLTSGADTDGRVRNDATVWDVVLSDELELRKLERIDRLAAVEGSNGSRYMVSLFFDPVGLSCRQKRLAARPHDTMSWNDLSGSLVVAGLRGEVVVAIPEAVQAILADAVVQPVGGGPSPEAGPPAGAPENQEGKRGQTQGTVPPESRVIFPEKLSAKEPRLSWLGQLYRETRAATLSVEGEMLNPRVSCVLTHYSKYRRLMAYFPETSPEELRFYVPDGRTVVRRFGVAITAESPRYALARRFVERLMADRQRLAEGGGFCVEGQKAIRSAMASDDACSSKILRSIDEFPVIPPPVSQALEYGHRAKRRKTTEKEPGP